MNRKKHFSNVCHKIQITFLLIVRSCSVPGKKYIGYLSSCKGVMHMYVVRSFHGAVHDPNDERCAILLPARTDMYVFFCLKNKTI